VALTRRQRARAWRALAILVPLAFVAWRATVTDWANIRRTYFDLDIAQDMFPEVVTSAAVNTLLITTGAFVLGLALGLLVAVMRLSPIRGYRWVAAVYIEVLRGIPALVSLIFFAFVLPLTLGFRFPALLGMSAQLVTAIAALGIVASAYLAETMRAGIEAVPKGQVEAARSLGMSPFRTSVSIVLPQAFRIVIPPLTNELVLLLKDSALVYVVGLAAADRELTAFGREAVNRTFNGTPIVVSALMYLALTIPLTRLAAQLEKRGARAR
jgi:polar amino acid transport system permease protein